MRTALIVWAALAGLSLGCGADPVPGPDFGDYRLSTLDEPCEGIAGLTGQSVLDQATDQVTATLGYVTRTGSTVSPTALTIDLTWPVSPVAVCYPRYTSGAFVVEPRVAIEGLSMGFTTADGKFDEALPAKAWRMSASGVATLFLVAGATSRFALDGSWTPFADYDNGGTTLTFVNRLAGALSSSQGGNVGLSGTTLAEAGAGAFRGGNAMALWPVAP